MALQMMKQDIRCPFCYDPETEQEASIVHVGSEAKQCPYCHANACRIFWVKERGDYQEDLFKEK